MDHNIGSISPTPLEYPEQEFDDDDDQNDLTSLVIIVRN